MKKQNRKGKRIASTIILSKAVAFSARSGVTARTRVTNVERTLSPSYERNCLTSSGSGEEFTVIKPGLYGRRLEAEGDLSGAWLTKVTEAEVSAKGVPAADVLRGSAA